MEALILSCGTGGGHDAAAAALLEEMERRGDGAVLLDPYTLVSPGLGRAVGNGYIRLAQRHPQLFGLLYLAGDLFRRLPVMSPVYEVNRPMARPLGQYLDTHPFDVILTTHPYPAEILTAMKAEGRVLPPSVFVATDYTCIPFVEETGCDAVVIPSERLMDEFSRRGIRTDRLYPLGIPVRKDFYEGLSREEAKARLGLKEERSFLLLTGGSIGAGQMARAVEHLTGYLKTHPFVTLICVCGSNEKIYRRLKRRCGTDPQILLIGRTGQMAALMKASFAVLTKPGGLTSTEAAVSGVPIVHISAVPGCELRNAAFFARLGMSRNVGRHLSRLAETLEEMENPPVREEMIRKEKAEIHPRAAQEICALAQSMVQAGTHQRDGNDGSGRCGSRDGGLW